MNPGISYCASQDALQGIYVSNRYCSSQNTPQGHSAQIRNLIKLKYIAKLAAQGEQVCLKDPKYILFEILENRTSSCWPSQPNCQIGLAQPAGACTALPCPIFQDFKQYIFGILEAYLFTLHNQFCCTFQLYQIPDQHTVIFYGASTMDFLIPIKTF